MADKDKTETPADDQKKGATPADDQIEDAEIVEEIPAEPETPETDDPIEIEEPGPEAVPDDLSDPQVAEDAADLPKDDTPEPGTNRPATPEAPPATDVETGNRARVVPLVLGGVVAAAIGFGAAFLLGNGPDAKTQETLAELRQQIADQGDLIAVLKLNQDKIVVTANGARETAAGLSGLIDTTVALGVRVDALTGQVENFDVRLADIEKRPLNEGLSAAAIAAYEREVEELKELVAVQKAEAADLKDKAALSAQAALARSSVTRIIAALENGAPYRAAIVDFGSATGQSVPAILEEYADTGMPTLAALLNAFPENARAALERARKDKLDEGTGSRLGNFLRNHLGARSVEPKEGTDTDAVLSRAEAALREGRLSGALGELDALAEGPASEIADWRAAAETRLAAMQAAEELAQSLNTN